MFDIDALLKSLPIMGWGMFGIFMVIGVIMICVAVLTKVFPPESEKEKDKD